MTHRSERLRSVQKIAESREQNAAREMGKARSRLTDLEKRLTELIAFREEYTSNLLVVGAAGMNVMRMREYQHFLSRLDQAITYQRNSVEQAKAIHADRQRVWVHLHGRMRALEKLVVRQRQQEQMDANQREQKETDERAQRVPRFEL